MNALFLLGIILCVFVMGYRFYAKFLALGVFRIDNEAPAPASQRGDDRDFICANRWLLLSHNTVSTVGILSVLGVGVAVVWGWIPAFLWIVVGTLVVGGTYAFAGLWASLRNSGDSLAGIVFDLAGAWGALPMYALGVTLLVFLCALLSVLLGQLLNAHPESSWSFLSLLAVPALIRTASSARTMPAAAVWAAAAAVIFVGALLFGQWLPLSLSGIWRFNVGETEVLSLSHELVWATVALALAYQSIRSPISSVARPRGALVGLLLIVIMIGVTAGLLLISPPLVAPEFRTDIELPGLFPLLFLVITGGAISGVYALIVTGPTVRQIQKQDDALVISYGSTIVDGFLAVLVLVVLCAGFTTSDEWLSLYGLWPEQAGLYVWLDLVITKMARFIAALGVPLPLAVAAVAAVLAALALSMLENLLRTLAYSAEELVEDFELEPLRGPYMRQRLAIGITAVAVLWLAQFDLGLNHWLVFGLANQLLAGSFMLVLGLILLRLSRPTLFVLLPALFILTCAIWGLIWLLLEWWQQREWALLFASCVIATLAAISLIACTIAFMKIRQQAGNSVAVPPTL